MYICVTLFIDFIDCLSILYQYFNRLVDYKKLSRLLSLSTFFLSATSIKTRLKTNKKVGVTLRYIVKYIFNKVIISSFTLTVLMYWVKL